ncbi:MAG: hypothetical protein R6W76_00765 [Caldilinea sp.]
MNFASCRYCAPFVVALFMMTLSHAAFAQKGVQAGATVPPATPERLIAGGFECKDTGYRDGKVPDDEKVTRPNRIPNGWELTYTGKMPVVDSARIYFAKSCDGSAHVAAQSHKNAAAARDKGKFKREIIPINGKKEDGTEFLVDRDQWIRDSLDLEKMKTMQSPFKENGRVTAATSSPLTAGAAAILMMNREKAEGAGDPRGGAGHYPLP